MISIPSLLLCIGFNCLQAKRFLMDSQKEMLRWLEEATLFPTEPHVNHQTLDLSFQDDLLIDVGRKAEQSKDEISSFDGVLIDILDDTSWMHEKAELSFLDEYLLQIKSDLSDPSLDWIDPKSALAEEELFAALDEFDPMENPCPLPPKVTVDEVQENDTKIKEAPPSESEESLISDVIMEVESSGPPSVAGSCTSYDVFSPGSSDGNSSSDESSLNGSIVGSTTFVPEPEVIVDIISDEFITPDKTHIPSKNMSALRKSVKDQVKVAPYKVKKEKRERKKVQNKEAAARYRVKKRLEDKELSGEVEKLEEEQKRLKEKESQISQELSCLKALMKDILKARKKSK